MIGPNWTRSQRRVFSAAYRFNLPYIGPGRIDRASFMESGTDATFNADREDAGVAIACRHESRRICRPLYELEVRMRNRRRSSPAGEWSGLLEGDRCDDVFELGDSCRGGAFLLSGDHQLRLAIDVHDVDRCRLADGDWESEVLVRSRIGP